MKYARLMAKQQEKAAGQHNGAVDNVSCRAAARNVEARSRARIPDDGDWHSELNVDNDSEVMSIIVPN